MSMMAHHEVRMSSVDELLAVAEGAGAGGCGALSRLVGAHGAARRLGDGGAVRGAGRNGGTPRAPGRRPGPGACWAAPPRRSTWAGTCRRPLTKRTRGARRSALIRRSPSPCATRSAPSPSTLTSRPRRKIPRCALWPRIWRATNCSTRRCCAIIGAAPFTPSGRPPPIFRESVDALRASAQHWDREAAVAHAALANALDEAGETEDAAIFRRLAAQEEKAAAAPPPAPAIPKLRSAADGLRLLEDGIRSLRADRRTVERRAGGRGSAAAGGRDGRPPRHGGRRAKQHAHRHRRPLIAIPILWLAPPPQGAGFGLT